MAHVGTMQRMLLIALVVVCACESGPLELTNDGREVVVPDRYRACSESGDCALVSISCDSCCARSAITNELQEEFERDRKKSCAGYSGSECDCSFVEAEARCERGRCISVELE